MGEKNLLTDALQQSLVDEAEDGCWGDMQNALSDWIPMGHLNAKHLRN